MSSFEGKINKSELSEPKWVGLRERQVSLCANETHTANAMTTKRKNLSLLICFTNSNIQSTYISISHIVTSTNRISMSQTISTAVLLYENVELSSFMSESTLPLWRRYKVNIKLPSTMHFCSKRELKKKKNQLFRNLLFFAAFGFSFKEPL